jgi:hypothetical protein
MTFVFQTLSCWKTNCLIIWKNILKYWMSFLVSKLNLINNRWTLISYVQISYLTTEHNEHFFVNCTTIKRTHQRNAGINTEKKVRLWMLQLMVSLPMFEFVVCCRQDRGYMVFLCLVNLVTQTAFSNFDLQRNYSKIDIRCEELSEYRCSRNVNSFRNVQILKNWQTSI